MKNNTKITILLFLSVLFQSPPTTSGAVAWPTGDDALRAWLAPLYEFGESTPVIDSNYPLLPVARFYSAVGYQAVWTGPDGLLPHGKILLNAMGSAYESGLFPDRERPSRLDSMRVNRVSVSKPPSLSGLKSYVQFDVILTEAILRFAQQLSQGQVEPETLSRMWLASRRPSTRDIPAELACALREDRLAAYIESLHPKGQAYNRLRKVLQHYEAIKASGGWPTIAPGPALRRGDKDSRVDALKRRLKKTSDLPGDVPSIHGEYDMMVEAAVKRFQRRNGLTVDGVVGKRTRAELNIPVDKRITQLQLNMERWRWFPDSFGDRYLLVNIPAFELTVVEANQPIDRIRVIVGKERRQTPVMSGRMTYLEINPYWNIPRKIARKDILPKVINDPTYLISQGIRVFDSWDRQAAEIDPTSIQWKAMSEKNFPYRLRQDPSKLNALGQIKFIFPNHLSVYIHDTPGKTLFNREKRSFSSGCVRVEAPMTLAQHLLNRQGWDHARLESVVAQGNRRAVLLDDPIPVHLVYFTAWVDDASRVNFREDIYGRDRQLLLALETALRI
jgi:murein L,D-transpeptidase YcbB/YkuD